MVSLPSHSTKSQWIVLIFYIFWKIFINLQFYINLSRFQPIQDHNSMSNIRYLNCRPYSCRFRDPVQLHLKQEERVVKRPITAIMSPTLKSRNDLWNDRNLGVGCGRMKGNRVVEKDSDCKSVFATDLRFILEEQNIRTMNLELSKFFGKEKGREGKHHTRRHGPSRDIQGGKKSYSRPMSALIGIQHDQAPKHIQKSPKGEPPAQLRKTLHQQQNTVPKISNQQSLNPSDEQFFFQMKKRRQQNQSFIRESKHKFSELLLHFQSDCYEVNPSYPDVKSLGDEFVATELQLVQQSIYTPKPNLATEDLVYLNSTIHKISELEQNISRIMSRPRINLSR